MKRPYGGGAHGGGPRRARCPHRAVDHAHVRNGGRPQGSPLRARDGWGRMAAGRVGRDAFIAPWITHTCAAAGDQRSPLRARDGRTLREAPLRRKTGVSTAGDQRSPLRQGTQRQCETTPGNARRYGSTARVGGLSRAPAPTAGDGTWMRTSGRPKVAPAKRDAAKIAASPRFVLLFRIPRLPSPRTGKGDRLRWIRSPRSGSQFRIPNSEFRIVSGSPRRDTSASASGGSGPCC